MGSRLPILSPTARRKALLTLWKHKPADYDSRGLFVGGPRMPTNWDLILRLMAISLLADAYEWVAHAIAKMERQEQLARQGAANRRLVQTVQHPTTLPRRRNRRVAA